MSANLLSRLASAHLPPAPTFSLLVLESMRASIDSSMAHSARHRPNMATLANPHPVYQAISVENLVSCLLHNVVVTDELTMTATPLNLANAASLDLLSPEEQQLCSALRILPKPYLLLKELYIRENERRKGLLKRRDAR